MSREFYTSLSEALTQTSGGVAVATIVRTRGSSPREVGARMLVRPDGSTEGSVGGGCGEAEVWRAALEAIEDQRPRMVVVDLTNEIAMTTDGVCGGVLDVFVEPWHTTSLDFTGATLDAIAQHRQTASVTVVSRSRGLPVAVGEKLLIVDSQRRTGGLSWDRLENRVLDDLPEVIAGGKSRSREYVFEDEPQGRVAVYFDLTTPRPTLVIFGAGHVALPLVQVGRLLDFEVVVVDDRPAYANPERFPDADRIIADDFVAAVDRITLTPSTYVVLVTRAHTHDVHVLRQVVRSDAAYIGMIGSRRRVYAVYKLLRDEGVPLENLLRVHAPIGLDLKTETPGEIAISIGAELLKVRRGGEAASFSDILRPQYRYSLTRGDADI